jgi:hypothetical protein
MKSTWYRELLEDLTAFSGKRDLTSGIRFAISPVSSLGIALLRSLQKPDKIAAIFFNSVFHRDGRIVAQLLVQIESFLRRGLGAGFISQAPRQVCVTLQKIRSQRHAAGPGYTTRPAKIRKFIWIHTGEHREAQTETLTARFLD